jgi:hypothetical protein
MNHFTPYPAESAQRRAERAAKAMRPELDELMREKLSAIVGFSEWVGKLDSPVSASFEQALEEVLRQLIESAEERDRSRPAFATVETVEAEPSRPLRRRAPRSPLATFPGYWRPDGTWRDSDTGPGGEGLAEYIESTLQAERGERLGLRLAIQSIDGGHLARERTYRRAELLGAEGEVRLPLDPVAEEDIEALVGAHRDRTARQLEEDGWSGAALDLRDGLSVETVLARVRGAGDYPVDRRLAVPKLEQLGRAIAEAERNLR